MIARQDHQARTGSMRLGAHVSPEHYTSDSRMRLPFASYPAGASSGGLCTPNYCAPECMPACQAIAPVTAPQSIPRHMNYCSEKKRPANWVDCTRTDRLILACIGRPVIICSCSENASSNQVETPVSLCQQYHLSTDVTQSLPRASWTQCVLTLHLRNMSFLIRRFSLSFSISCQQYFPGAAHSCSFD